MAAVTDNEDSQSTKSLLAAHTRKFTMRMTVLLVICFVGIALIAFFLLRGSGKVATPVRNLSSSKSSSLLTPQQAVNSGGLTVVNSGQPGSTDQADVSSQAALQNSAAVGTADSSASSAFQHAASVNGDDNPGQDQDDDNDGVSHSPIQSPVNVNLPVKVPIIGGCGSGGPVHLVDGHQVMTFDHCMQVQ